MTACLNISNQNTSRPTGNDMFRPATGIETAGTTYGKNWPKNFARMQKKRQGGGNCPGDGSDMGTAKSGAIYGFWRTAIEVGLPDRLSGWNPCRQSDLVRISSFSRGGPVRSRLDLTPGSTLNERALP
ncbi:hypothetical protein [Mesorhizobium sp.]|uniref:hypothetical protein n=1 Tax=Mesorhizobium sp. TaxID=1871066 RepID=UPI000FE6090C|nr:hypothetical protein [Mesorhizobium sp.]RWG83345.1 MAG: hypothetical protein EOQ70_21175 [Mesorhizobium sp.]